MRISDWSSDVCSSDLPFYAKLRRDDPVTWLPSLQAFGVARYEDVDALLKNGKLYSSSMFWPALLGEYDPVPEVPPMISMDPPGHVHRSEEHTSELQSLMRISYAVFCLKKKKKTKTT